jgi:hypothetical protein
MRKAMILGTAIVALAALSVIGSATASAALPEFLPAEGTFTSTSGAGTLAIEEGNTITCESDTNTGSITGAKTVKLTVEFKGCKIFGFIGASSAGDASGVILVEATGELCYLSKAAKTVGLTLTLTKNVVISAAGQKSEVKGKFIGEVKPVNTATTKGELILKEEKGLQSIKKCEGGAETELEANENGGAFKKAGETTTDTITFAKSTTIDA